MAKFGGRYTQYDVSMFDNRHQLKAGKAIAKASWTNEGKCRDKIKHKETKRTKY
jgi:hypothetical protein